MSTVTMETILKDETLSYSQRMDLFMALYRSIPRFNLEEHLSAAERIKHWYNNLPKSERVDPLSIKVHYCLAFNAYIRGDYETFFKIQHAASKLMVHEDSLLYLALIIRLKAYSCYVIGIMDEAIESAHLALQYFKQINHEEEIIRSYIALGVCYSLSQEYDLQLKYFSKGLQRARELNDVVTEKMLLNNIGYTAFLKGDYDYALSVINQGLEIIGEDEDSLGAAGLIINQTRLALHAKDYLHAEDLLMQAMSLKTVKNDRTLSMDCSIIAYELYSSRNKIKEARHALDEGLNLSETVQSKKYTKLFHTKLSVFYEELCNYEMAYKHLNQALKIDELMAKEQSNYQYLLLKIQNELDDVQEALELTQSELRGTQEVTIYALATLAEFKDQVTGNHILRTTHYAKLFCTCLMKESLYLDIMQSAFIEAFSKSSALHDIGKVGVKDSILNKPGKLTPEEFEEVKLHTEYGRRALAITERILGNQSFLTLAQTIAYTHHEKWDGTGYPELLKGEEIPLVGRIMAIIDVYDALISRRAYKEPFTHTTAIDIIAKGRGTHFDPVLCDIFLKYHMDFFEIALVLFDDEDERPILDSDTALKI